MTDGQKRALQILGFLFTMVFLFFLFYLAFLRPSSTIDPENLTDIITDDQPAAGSLTPSGDRLPAPQPGENDTGDGTLSPSPIADGGETLTTQLTTGPVTSPTADGNDIVYYDPTDGLFYRIDRNGNIVPISEDIFPEAESVQFNSRSNTAILEFPDGSNILYNLDSRRQITMPSHWEDFDFSPQGDQIVGKSIVDENNAALITMNTDGSQAFAIADMGENANRVEVDWSPGGNIVAFSSTGPAQAGFGRRAVLLIDENGDAPASIIVDGNNFSGEWSPDGERIVYSTVEAENGDRPSLWVVNGRGDAAGSNRRRINVSTWIEKCTFKDAETLICAVPQSIEPNRAFDYRFSTAPDDVYEIDILTGRRSLLATTDSGATMNNLSLSSDATVLYFTDEDNILNSLRLR